MEVRLGAQVLKYGRIGDLQSYFAATWPDRKSSRISRNS